MKTVYFDCFSGISGDMLLGSLLDAGLPFDILDRTLHTLPLSGYRIQASREQRGQISGTRFKVLQTHESHTHRRLKDIVDIVNGGDLNNDVKERCITIFESIARVEGEIHGEPMDAVLFHEVGAIDSIIDIVGVVFGIDHMNISESFTSRLPLGSGFTESRHGRIPLPAPATVALLKGIPVYDSGLTYEMVTPTGAAIVAALCNGYGELPPMRIDVVGYGVGSRDFSDRPNLLRIMIGTAHERVETDTVVILEAHIDDMTPELLGFVMDRLFEAGALDVVFIPLHMKKNRPGIQIQVIGKPHEKDGLMNTLFRESTTLGIRIRYCQRKILDRSQTVVHSPWGMISVKKVITPNGSVRIVPEYDVCRRIAEQRNIPLQDIYSWIGTVNNV